MFYQKAVIFFLFTHTLLSQSATAAEKEDQAAYNELADTQQLNLVVYHMDQRCDYLTQNDRVVLDSQINEMGRVLNNHPNSVYGDKTSDFLNDKMKDRAQDLGCSAKTKTMVDDGMELIAIKAAGEFCNRVFVVNNIYKIIISSEEKFALGEQHIDKCLTHEKLPAFDNMLTSIFNTLDKPNNLADSELLLYLKHLSVLLEKASNKGSAISTHNLALFYNAKPKGEISKLIGYQPIEFMKWTKMSASLGYPDSVVNLALRLMPKYQQPEFVSDVETAYVLLLKINKHKAGLFNSELVSLVDSNLKELSSNFSTDKLLELNKKSEVFKYEDITNLNVIL